MKQDFKFPVPVFVIEDNLNINYLAVSTNKNLFKQCRFEKLKQAVYCVRMTERRKVVALLFSFVYISRLQFVRGQIRKYFRKGRIILKSKNEN